MQLYDHCLLDIVSFTCGGGFLITITTNKTTRRTTTREAMVAPITSAVGNGGCGASSVTVLHYIAHAWLE